jgi:hypothetical protein
VLGFTCQFAPLGELDPRISVGYEFPLDGGAREELQWGVVSQFFLEF